jgi:hypothetical protein
LFIIKEGSVKCLKGKREIRKLNSRDYFGESAVLFGTKRSLSVIAGCNINCYMISKSVLFESLGENFIEIILKSITKGAFEKNKHFMLFLFDTYYNKIYSALKLNFYQNNSIIEKENLTNKLMIILEGNLMVIIIYFRIPKIVKLLRQDLIYFSILLIKNLKEGKII